MMHQLPAAQCSTILVKENLVNILVIVRANVLILIFQELCQELRTPAILLVDFLGNGKRFTKDRSD